MSEVGSLRPRSLKSHECDLYVFRDATHTKDVASSRPTRTYPHMSSSMTSIRYSYFIDRVGPMSDYALIILNHFESIPINDEDWPRTFLNDYVCSIYPQQLVQVMKLRWMVVSRSLSRWIITFFISRSFKNY